MIDSPQIEELPLLGRDVYTLLATEPGVTSDSATGRGLGLSVNGQRPSASNFLMDGLENNNYLITGPLVTVAPEAVQEYRISTNNFSAEYGRASGFLANTITRTGTNQFHGIGYFYLENDVLNANGFQENRQGIARQPHKQIQPGFVLGGPILKNRLFFSSSYEFLQSRSFSDPQPFTFPNPSVFLSAFAVTPDRTAYQLLTKYAPVVVGGPGVVNSVMLRRTGGHWSGIWGWSGWIIPRLTARTATWRVCLLQRVTEPDFIWTPYPDFISALHQNTEAVGEAISA